MSDSPSEHQAAVGVPMITEASIRVYHDARADKVTKAIIPGPMFESHTLGICMLYINMICMLYVNIGNIILYVYSVDVYIYIYNICFLSVHVGTVHSRGVAK